MNNAYTFYQENELKYKGIVCVIESSFIGTT